MEAATYTNDIARVVESDRAHVWHHLIQHKPFETVDPRVIVEGKGMRVWDAKGKEHLDAVSGGVWTVNVGYGRESIANAVRDQLIRLCYFAGSAGTIPGAQFAERLIGKMPGMSRVYYANSGSEANEKVFKMVRQIAHRTTAGASGRSSTANATTTAPPSPPCRLRPAAAHDAIRPLRPGLRRGAALPGIPRAMAGGRITANAPPMRSRR
jgi:4-aminobutyrate aminotransferase-like enzyme